MTSTSKARFKLSPTTIRLAQARRSRIFFPYYSLIFSVSPLYSQPHSNQRNLLSIATNLLQPSPHTTGYYQHISRTRKKNKAGKPTTQPLRSGLKKEGRKQRHSSCNRGKWLAGVENKNQHHGWTSQLFIRQISRPQNSIRDSGGRKSRRQLIRRLKGDPKWQQSPTNLAHLTAKDRTQNTRVDLRKTYSTQ